MMEKGEGTKATEDEKETASMPTWDGDLGMAAPGDAPPAGSGSWFTLISGVAAGEPSGGGEGLLFPFSGAPSLQKDKRRRMSVGTKG